MKKILLTTTLLMLLLPAVAASTDTTAKDSTKRAWKVTDESSLGFSQVALSNWSAGGESSYSLNALVNLNATRTLGPKHLADTLNMGYGIQQMEHQGTKAWNGSNFIINTQYGYRAFCASGTTPEGLTCKTQLTKGYDYNVTPKQFTSTWFAPAYLLASKGYGVHQHQQNAKRAYIACYGQVYHC